MIESLHNSIHNGQNRNRSKAKKTNEAQDHEDEQRQQQEQQPTQQELLPLPAIHTAHSAWKQSDDAPFFLPTDGTGGTESINEEPVHQVLQTQSSVTDRGTNIVTCSRPSAGLFKRMLVLESQSSTATTSIAIAKSASGDDHFTDEEIQTHARKRRRRTVRVNSISDSSGAKEPQDSAHADAGRRWLQAAFAA